MSRLTKVKLQIAFTLIELLVVIAIVGILSGLIIVGMNNSVQSANTAKIQIFSASLRDSLLMSLASEWKFDETSGTVANDTWSTNNGNLTNFAFDANDGWLSGSQCISGGCLKFDGVDDYVTVPKDFTSGLRAVTIEGWVNGQQASNLFRTANSAIILHFRGAGFYLIGSDSTVSGYLGWSNTLPFNTWTHLVATWDNTTMSLYVNGVKQANTLAFAGGSTGTLLGSTWFNIGYYFNAGQPYFKGLVDNVRLYSAAIPTSKIKENYYAGINRLIFKKEINKEEYYKRITEFVSKGY